MKAYIISGAALNLCCPVQLKHPTPQANAETRCLSGRRIETPKEDHFIEHLSAGVLSLVSLISFWWIRVGELCFHWFVLLNGVSIVFGINTEPLEHPAATTFCSEVVPLETALGTPHSAIEAPWRSEVFQRSRMFRLHRGD